MSFLLSGTVHFNMCAAPYQKAKEELKSEQYTSEVGDIN